MDNCIIDPHSIAAPIGIVSSELTSFSNKTGGVNIFGGFSKDGKRGWVATDSFLDVICTRSGNRLASFNFSQVAGSSATITCVRDYPYHRSYQLLVGLQTASKKGMVCRFRPHSSKLLTVVNFPHVVTAIDCVTSVGGVESPNFALSDELRRFFGIIAVGTKGGHVYMLDMKLDEDVEFWDMTQGRPAQIIAPGIPDIDQRRLKAAAKGEHLCLDLNNASPASLTGDAFSYYSFNYCKPDGKIFKTFPISDVSVTSLTYIPQIGSLAVGFNFGSFQLWRLADTSLEYSGPLSRHPSPVTHFAYQEPEDDPQNFCYLWVARGPVISDSKDDQETLTDIHLFQLAYEKKIQHPKHGHMFKDLVDCIGRFEHYLTANPLDSNDVVSLGSRLLACYTLDRALPTGYKIHDDSTAEEEVNPKDLSLAVFVWEGCPANMETQETTNHFIALFDLDRYYQAQMPSFIKCDELTEPPPYFSFYNLEAVIDAASPDFALNVHLDKSSLTKYQSTCQSVPEPHLHPSSLSFNVVCLAEGSLVHAGFLGIQRKILADMCNQGPTLLREPRPFYLRCWNAHLIPRRSFAEQIPSGINQVQQREDLLTLALEHNQLGFLVACISSWSQGDFTSGMNLRSILEWSWGKVASIKQTVDEICVPLYDGYGTTLDSHSYKLLKTCSTQLCHMIDLFQALLDQSGTTTDQGVKDLETKLGVVTLLSQHLQMVLWFSHSGLLPECGDDLGSPLHGQFCYPSSLLHQTYAQRRAELSRMCRNSGNSDIMLIDGLVSEAGPALTSLWDRKDQGGTGAYPPPSLHALLDMFLLENVPLATKHCIVGYLLLDIISVSHDAKHSEMVEDIEKFHQVFSLPLGLTKLLQAFWLLDHRDYEEALAMLLDPNTNNDLLSWQHTRIIKTFLYHGQAKMALHYVRCVRPALDTPDDIKLHLTVLLANGLTAEAFQFQREYRDPSTMDELLYHIFLGSQQTKTMDQLLRLPFDDIEESVLERYLLETTEPNSKELLVMHYLQRTRFVDAVRLNETLKQQALMGDNDPLARERTSARNIITESYVNVLPRVQRRLAFDSDSRQKKPVGIRREVPRPKPLSTIINPAKTSKVISHALLLNAVLDRIAEARDVMKADQTPTKLQDESYDSSPCIEPFVGTPMTPRNRTARSADVSVVYPETLEAEDSATYHPFSTSLNASINQSLRGLGGMETPKVLKESFKRPPLDYSGAEALALLQTPPVKRRTPAVHQEPQVAPPTPQSILKVRKVIRRSPSPPKVVTERARGFAAVDITLPTPPQFHRKTLSFAEEDSEKTKEATPARHIRFSDDTILQDSPSPDINELVPEPPSFIPGRNTPSPNVEQQAWATPPLSPQISPTKEAAETPPFQSPMEGIPPEQARDSSVSPTRGSPPSPTRMEEQVVEGAGHLILTPKMKPPTPQHSRIITPKEKPPSVRRPSPLRQPSEENEQVLQSLYQDDDSQTPPIPEGMVLNLDNVLHHGDQTGQEEDGEEDEEITFNFSLRHPGTPASAEAPQEREEPVPMAMEDVEMDADEQMDTEGPTAQREPSPAKPPEFIFQPSPRRPIHSLAPFQFQESTTRSPSSVPLPTPPRESRDFDVEQAFLDKGPPVSEDWQLTFDAEDTEDEDEVAVAEGEPKVRFGEKEVFEIPAVPKHVRESVHIQTSPMSGATFDLSQQPIGKADVQEMSVQTTPGLALRTREVEKTPPRVPFSETLKDREGTQRQEDQEVTEGPRDSGKLDSPMDVQADIPVISPPKPPSLTIPRQEDVKESPRRSPVTRSMTTPSRSSPRTQMRQEQQKEEPTTPAQPSFIFSPPLTRSRGRRSAVKIITKETAPPVPPSFSQTASETVLTVPSPLPGESMVMASGGRGTRSGRRGRGGNASMTQIKDKPAITPVRGSRRSLAVSHIPSPSEADSVVLLSPATTEQEPDAQEKSLRRNPRRAVRVAPHSMTLRTPQEKKKVRKLKAW
ncbi:protein ELYS-like isoform X1 [Lytechinus variegatus]|uniref:protein ELYS-like isoform X1 n=1 Tax=Lytechinus variegatus TaxID=7654 RepID=UPI001BB0D9F2|nr:protein ELYS-like isoform X1 [Lytechinus variegatus]XP_041480739.1 protein ELYS-like isoform X2 [Lytechinus variegatus]XP_041480740.1 protein ELYS-like isoform X1 [Lytechinus variegatus]